MVERTRASEPRQRRAAAEQHQSQLRHLAVVVPEKGRLLCEQILQVLHHFIPQTLQPRVVDGESREVVLLEFRPPNKEI